METIHSSKTAILFSLMLVGFNMTDKLSAASEKSGEDIFYPMKAETEKSIMFKRLKDGKILYQTDPKKKLIPASLTKLLTAAASLHTFGPAYKFNTKIFYSGSIQDSILTGDMFIVGNGDPFFTNEKLWQLAADIRHMGIRRIKGDLVIDNSIFDAENYDPSRESAEEFSEHAYDAPISAFGVNFNTFPIAVSPGPKVGTQAIVEIDPYSIKGVIIDNRIRTARHGQGNSFSIKREVTSDGTSKLILNGHIALGSKLYKVYRSVSNPLVTSGETLRSFLVREGVAVIGQVKSGVLPQNSRLLITVESYPLGYIVEGLNKYSNNFIADVLLKRLGATLENEKPEVKTIGSFKSGIDVINLFLKKEVGIGDEYVLKNGSGLDLDNRLSADQLTSILSYVYNRIDIFPEFFASLPSAGKDGTLSKRFREKETKILQGKVRAKTGTLSEPYPVVGLAGYLNHPLHGLIAFTIIENGIPGKAQSTVSDIRERQDFALLEFINNLDKRKD
ncbi:MAG: D-alanyl-D-alanine carboxypeptidase/D-alanyl-D-alanine-endopeptidase [Oligoflexales bacterium]|nr:D-alanyl-D-alanine carboxypeptidase/D-alanyl-D-alanine-endopeptidase [Oligoflexales bacterium]